MITLTINAETTHELHRELLALLAGTAMVAAGAAAPAEPAKTSGRGKKADKVEPPTAGQPIDPNVVGGGAAEGATGSEGQSSAPGEVTKDSLSPRVLQLGSKAGPSAVQELFKEFNAAKFSEVSPERYGELNARLDQLLAD